VEESEINSVMQQHAITVRELHNRGKKIVINNLQEANYFEYKFKKPKNEIGHRLWNVNWFWYSESFINKHRNYYGYTPVRRANKLALMPMNFTRYHRDLLVNKLSSYLDRLLYSYRQHGIQLPNDEDFQSGGWDRFFNPDWYDSTCFSVVTESYVDQRLLSEKTFKPIAFYHPFLILGHCGILTDLKNMGFETFDNIFDESYDSEICMTTRCNIIVDNIKKFLDIEYVEIAQDTITQAKLQHNHDLFYNEKIITERVITEIINPLIEYAET